MTEKMLVLASLLAGVVLAVAESSHCCSALETAGLAERLIYPGYEAYDIQVNKYFSTSARLTPSCFPRPEAATEVSIAVTALVEANKTQPCQFAVRSGGHMHYAGAAGIESGVTIDLGKMNDVVVNFVQNGTISVGPGAVWGDVYDTLDKMAFMVVGGRSYSVGVAGLILGGGNSYFAAREGLACDNVAEFEVVLADGSIVTANKHENVDLHQAFKGGGPNFGIVTRVHLVAYPGGDVFGGLMLYPESTAQQQFEALLNYGDKIEQDPFDSAIVIEMYLSTMKVPLFMNAYEYTAPVQHPAVFEEFFAIPGNISDTTGIRNMTSLARGLEQQKTHRVQFSTLTFKNDIRVLQKAHELFKQVVAILEEKATGDYSLMTLYQPIPRIFGQIGKVKGGNVSALDRFDETLLMYEPYIAWQDSSQDELFEGQARWLRDQLSAYAKDIDADNELLYLDYADISQNPLASYGRENVEKIRAAAQKYDQVGVFQQMMPGAFKISRVSSLRWPCSNTDGANPVQVAHDQSAAHDEL
ncbi:FAD-dependent monooxygenase sdcF [Fulvia fulva]|nr:FAD-dependent monooxygenase sdcF [Fulvia fulva]WPV26628.1 FAD-dependent monooxygenase sdcF [Fulvia fulva]